MKCMLLMITTGLLVATMNIPQPGWATDNANSERYVVLANTSKKTGNTDERAIQELIERYRVGYQHADPSLLTEVYADYTPTLSAALFEYRQTVKDLTVRIEGVRIRQLDDRQAIATFTRWDNFIDVWTGKEVQVRADLTKKFIRQNGLWKMFAVAEE
ncbi:MAG: hypothetical protein AB7P69_18670 [Candidatus Binatia bacterium]